MSSLLDVLLDHLGLLQNSWAKSWQIILNVDFPFQEMGYVYSIHSLTLLRYDLTAVPISHCPYVKPLIS